MHKSSFIVFGILAVLTLPAVAQESAEPAERPRLDEGSGFSRTGTPKERIPPPSPNDPFQFILDRGIRVEDHPNGIGLHAPQAPGLAAVCDLATYLPCARILWVLRYPPVSGATYQAMVPARVQLHGPASDVWWTPSVHCVTYEPRRRARNKVSSGQSCLNIVDAETQQMEWLIGGRIEGLDSEKHGSYEGWIPVTITMGSQHWIVDVPVTYKRFQPVRACGLEGNAGNMGITGIPHQAEDANRRGGTVGVEASTAARDNLTLSGDIADYCDDNDCSGISYSTGWVRIQADESETWTLDVSSISFDGGGNTSSDWTWVVGYYDYDEDGDGHPFVIETARAPSFSESTTDIWYDSDREAHFFLGGSIEIQDDWAPGSYSQTATITFCCGC